MHGAQWTADGEVARQQGQAGDVLLAGEGDRIARRREALRTQDTLGRRAALQGGELLVAHQHDAGAGDAAPAIAVGGAWGDAGVAQRLAGGGEREGILMADELVQAGFERVGRDVRRLGGDAHREAAGVEAADGRHATHAGEQVGPGRRPVGAERRHQADAGDDDAGAGHRFTRRPAPAARPCRRSRR